MNFHIKKQRFPSNYEVEGLGVAFRETRYLSGYINQMENSFCDQQDKELKTIMDNSIKRYEDYKQVYIEMQRIYRKIMTKKFNIH
jgi:hypothetical protein